MPTVANTQDIGSETVPWRYVYAQYLSGDGANITNLNMDNAEDGTLAVARGGTGQTSIANIRAGKDGDGNTISSTYLKLSGGTMTGAISRYYSAASTDPVLRVVSNDKDAKVFEVGHGTSASTVASCSYTLLYKGIGSSPNNTLILQARKSSNAYTDAIIITEEGKVTFAQKITGTITNADQLTNSLTFTNVKADGSDAGVVIFNGSSPKTISSKTINALNLAGDTMEGRLTTTKPINQILVGTGEAGGDKGTSVAATRYRPAEWKFDTGLTATDGDIVTIKIPVAGHSYGVYLSIDNGATYYPVVLNGTGRLTTHYPVNTYITVVFEANGSAASMLALHGQANTTTATVTDGVWRVINYYDSNSTYNLGDNFWYNTIVAQKDIVKNTIIVGDKDGYETLSGTSVFDIRYPILYTTAAVTATQTNYANLYTTARDITLTGTVSSFSGGAANKIAYIVGTLNGTIFTVTNPILTATEPTTADGKVYIAIGKFGNNSNGSNYFYFDPGVQPNMYAFINNKFQALETGSIQSLSISNATVSYTDILGNTGAAFTIPTAAGTSTLAWNTEVTLGTIAGLAIKAKLPVNPNTNTDTLVKQTAKTDNVEYKLLATTSASPSSGTAMEATYSANIFANPSTGALSAPQHMLNISGTNKAYMQYNSTDDSIDFVFI